MEDGIFGFSDIKTPSVPSSIPYCGGGRERSMARFCSKICEGLWTDIMVVQRYFNSVRGSGA